MQPRRSGATLVIARQYFAPSDCGRICRIRSLKVGMGQSGVIHETDTRLVTLKNALLACKCLKWQQFIPSSAVMHPINQHENQGTKVPCR